MSTEMSGVVTNGQFAFSDAVLYDFMTQGASLMQIVVFCVSVYGALAIAWVIYKRVPEKSRPPSLELALLCATFLCMSVGMNVLNKSLVTALQAPALVTSAQMAMAVLALSVTSMNTLLQTDPKMLLTWLLVPGLFAAMLISSFYTYTFISLSLLTVVRNLGPLVSIIVETAVMPPEKRPVINVYVVSSILLMLIGAVIYAGGLTDVSKYGIMFGVLNLCLAVTERMTSRRLLVEECRGMKLEICTLVNNFFGLIPALAVAYAVGGTSVNGNEPTNKWTDPGVVVMLVLSGAIGLGINYFGNAVQRIISATSFLVLQNLSKIAVVCMGVVFFQDPIKSVSAVSGLALSVGGSYLYGKAQMQIAADVEQKKLLEQSEKDVEPAHAFKPN
jgi:solute carrier family 35 protein